MKTTKKEYLEMAKEIVMNSDSKRKSEICDFLQKEIERVGRLSTVVSPLKESDFLLKEEIKKELTRKESLTVTELVSYLPRTYKAGNKEKILTTQKVTALLKQLMMAGLVKRETNKKKTLFSLVTEQEKEESNISYFEWVTADELPEPSEETFFPHVVMEDEYVEYNSVA